MRASTAYALLVLGVCIRGCKEVVVMSVVPQPGRGEGEMISGGVRWGETLQKCHSNLTFKKCPPGWSGRRCSWPLVEREGEEEKCV